MGRPFIEIARAAEVTELRVTTLDPTDQEWARFEADYTAAVGDPCQPSAKRLMRVELSSQSGPSVRRIWQMARLMARTEGDVIRNYERCTIRAPPACSYIIGLLFQLRAPSVPTEILI